MIEGKHFIYFIFGANEYLLKISGERWFLIFLVTAIGLLLYTRFNYIHIPFERDEGEYAYAGSLLVHGHYPYKEAYNMKFPGSYFMNALIMKAGGESVEAIRTGVALIVLLTALMAACVAYLFTKNTTAAALTGAVFLLLTNTMGGEGLMANAEHFVNFFAVSGILLTLVFLRRINNPFFLFVAGILLGLAVIMKQYGYAFCVFGVALLIEEYLRKSVYTTVKMMMVLGMGCLFPVALLCLWIVRNGLWQKFWFLTFKYAYAYIGLGCGNVGKSLMQIVGSAAPVCVLVVIAVLVTLLCLRQRDARILIMWVIFSILAFSTGFYLRVHYFILAYPALAVVTGYAYQQATRKTGVNIAGLVIAALLLLFFVMDREEQFPSDPVAVFNRHYPWGMFAEMPKIAQRVNQLIATGDKLSFFGNEPEVYFYPHRIAASGYIYNYSFFEQQPYAYKMMDEFIGEAEANPSPLFVYYTGSLEQSGPEYEHFGKWWKLYSQKYYLKDVYIANTVDSGLFLGEEKIKSDNSWKGNSIRAEFWMRKN